MPTYTYDELTPIVPGQPKGAPGEGAAQPAPDDVEVWPFGPPPPAGQPQPGEGKGEKDVGKMAADGKPEKGKPGEGKPGKGKGKRGTLTDTEKIIDKSDGTARGVIKRIYDEAKRKTHRMGGQAGKEAGNSLQVFGPLIDAKIDWPRLLKRKVRFFADKVGKKLKQYPSYLMYPWKAQAQVGIIAKAPLRKPKKNYIYMIFAFDTSGSITSDDMQNIVNELNSVAKTFEAASGGVSGKVFAMEWDTTVHQFMEFKPSKKIEVRGGGGTDPGSIFRYIDKTLVKEEKDGKYLLQLGPSDMQPVKSWPGTKYSTAPFLVIFTDGAFSPMTKQTLGKVYGMSEDNIFYIVTIDPDTRYPKKDGNHIMYDQPKF